MTFLTAIAHILTTVGLAATMIDLAAIAIDLAAIATRIPATVATAWGTATLNLAEQTAPLDGGIGLLLSGGHLGLGLKRSRDRKKAAAH